MALNGMAVLVGVVMLGSALTLVTLMHLNRRNDLQQRRENFEDTS